MIDKAQQIIQAGITLSTTMEARGKLESITFSKGYIEPGYDDPASGLIAIGDFSPVTVSSSFALLIGVCEKGSFHQNASFSSQKNAWRKEAPVCLVNSFGLVLQQISGVMTAPTWNHFQLLIAGWVFARRRTVTGMIEAAGQMGVRHHSLFHRVFAKARWSLDRLGLALFDLLRPFCGETVFLVIDDTLANKRGHKVFGTGMHYDPMLSSRSVKVTRWAHSWVVLGVIVRFPLWPERPFCVPILFRLYLNKKSAAKHRRVYRTRPQLAVTLLQILSKHDENADFHLLADSSYGGESVLSNLPRNCDLTSRLVLNARLHAAPPRRKPGTNGRPRKRGKRLATPEEMLKQRGRRITVDLYGRSTRMRVVDVVARVFKVPDRDLRVVATEALAGGRGREVFYSTSQMADAVTILEWYAQRWSIEVTFRESKQHLGFQEPQGWTRKAVERSARPGDGICHVLLRDFSEKVNSVVFSPDGKQIVSGGGLVIVWDISKSLPADAGQSATTPKPVPSPTTP